LLGPLQACSCPRRLRGTWALYNMAVGGYGPATREAFAGLESRIARKGRP